jgi:hypothetical protein
VFCGGESAYRRRPSYRPAFQLDYKRREIRSHKVVKAFCSTYAASTHKHARLSSTKPAEARGPALQLLNK